MALGRFSIAFYKSQQDRLGTDSGFRELGYLILSVTRKDERAAAERVAMQRAAGLDVRVVDAAQACRLNPTLSRLGHRGGSYCATDGAIDPPRNVRAYSLAMQQAGVRLRERTAFLGLRTVASRGGRRRVTGVRTSEGVIATERVILTGGPTLRAVGRLVGARNLRGWGAHQVVVTEPHPAFEVERLPMVFDVGAGLYWRLEEGGLLWGMSNPKERRPGRRGEASTGPTSRAWSDAFTSSCQRPAASASARSGAPPSTTRRTTCRSSAPVQTTKGVTIEGTTVASAGGHGMMWGPGVARVAADLALEGRSGLVDVTGLGMDRFDEHGRSPYLRPDRAALPA